MGPDTQMDSVGYMERMRERDRGHIKAQIITAVKSNYGLGAVQSRCPFARKPSHDMAMWTMAIEIGADYYAVDGIRHRDPFRNESYRVFIKLENKSDSWQESFKENN